MIWIELLTRYNTNLYEYLRYSEAIRFDKLGFKIFISLLTSFISVYVFNIYPVKSDKN